MTFLAKAICVIAVVAIAATPACSQSETQGAAFKLANAAFQCAEFAHYDLDGASVSNIQERNRLLALGILQGRKAGADALWPGGVAIDVAGAPPNLEFWLGFVLARATDDAMSEINDQIGPEVTKPADRAAEYSRLSSLAFSQHNCAVLR